MVRRLLFLVLLGVLTAVVASGVLGLAMVWVRQPVFSTITSPDGVVSVQLKGYPNRPINPITTNSVYYDLFRDGQPIVSDKYLHSGDTLEPSFNESYKLHNWVSNSVLRFSREDMAAGKCDTLVVSNFTAKPIAYLHIWSNDLFFVLDLKPGADVRLCATPQKTVSSIRVEGAFADRSPIPFKGSSFRIDYQPGTFEYRVTIAPDGPKIRSSQLAEYKPGSDSQPE